MSYHKIIEHYEACLEKHGDTHLGVDWPNKEDAETRYKVMLEVIKTKNAWILDYGCGLGHLYTHLLHSVKWTLEQKVKYSGYDKSEKFIDFCWKKFHKRNFYKILPDWCYDYIIACGVFTEKVSLTYDQMWQHFTNTLLEMWQHANTGIAFNLMSKNVDWERDDLFHVPLDPLTDFLCKNLSRNFVIRNDYGLYEYTVYVYK